MAGATTAIGDDGGRAFHDRLPVGIGHIGDEDFTGAELMHLGDRIQHAYAAGADLLADGASFYEHRAAFPDPVALDTGGLP
jgi:hypothetical protein